MRKAWVVGGLLAAPVAVGCANVSVTKVPVAARASGQDAQVEGFRYYLTRPYVLVKRPVELDSSAVAVRLIKLQSPRQKDGPDYVLKSVVPDPVTKAYRYFERDGRENAGLKQFDAAPTLPPPASKPAALGLPAATERVESFWLEISAKVTQAAGSQR